MHKASPFISRLCHWLVSSTASGLKWFLRKQIRDKISVIKRISAVKIMPDKTVPLTRIFSPSPRSVGGRSYLGAGRAPVTSAGGSCGAVETRRGAQRRLLAPSGHGRPTGTPPTSPPHTNTHHTPPPPPQASSARPRLLAKSNLDSAHGFFSLTGIRRNTLTLNFACPCTV